MNDKAIISWNEQEYRYELHIDGKLKAYSDGHASTKDSHAEGRKALIQLAEEKGYSVETKEVSECK